MTARLNPTSDLGLQHVLENGLLILQGGSLPAVRREQILERLVQIFSEADRGAETLRSQKLMFAVQHQPAFERFSIFFRYLKDSESDVPKSLSEATEVLRQLQYGNVKNETQKSNLVKVIEKLLGGLRRERALTPLVSPKNISFS